MPGFEDLKYVCHLRVFGATSTTLVSLIIYNVSWQPLRGAVLGTVNTKVLCHDNKIRCHPLQRKLFGAIYVHRDDQLSFID